jgi:hypothetical protein
MLMTSRECGGSEDAHASIFALPKLLRGAEHAPSLAPAIGAAFDQEAAPTTGDEAS